MKTKIKCSEAELANPHNGGCLCCGEVVERDDEVNDEVISGLGTSPKKPTRCNRCGEIAVMELGWLWCMGVVELSEEEQEEQRPWPQPQPQPQSRLVS